MMLPIYKFAMAVESQIAPRNNEITGTEKAVLRGMKARGYRLADTQHDSELMGEIKDLVAKAGLEKMPKVILYAHEAPNAAMVYDSTMFISTSALKLLDKQERVGVLAHEIGHAKQHPWNAIVSFGSVFLIIGFAGKIANQMVGLVEKVPNPFKKKKPDGTRPKLFQSRDAFSMTVLFDAAFLLVAGVITAARSAFSRHQELDADKKSAEITGNPKALARSLKKLEGAYAKMSQPVIIGPTDAGKTTLSEQAYKQTEAGNRELFKPKKHSKFFRSHPAINERVGRLNGMEQRVPDEPSQVEEKSHAARVFDLREEREKLDSKSQRA